MRKWINSNPVKVLLVVCCAFVVIAAKSRGVPIVNALWVAGETDTSGNVTVDAYDDSYNGYIKGDLEVDGTIYADGGITDATGGVTADEIADVTRTIYFDIGAAAVDSANDVDDASAPNLTTLDNIPAILWDDSTETAAVQWTFPVPSDYVSGVVFYAMVSSNDASGTGTKLDWALTKNATDTPFGSPTSQDLVECVSSALDGSNEVLTLTPDATGAALFVDGAIITLELFNASTNDDDLELKAVWAKYTATQ